MNATLTVLALMACLIVLATLWTYERRIADLRRERDEFEADCELFSQLLIDNAIARHPATLQSTNVRVLRRVK